MNLGTARLAINLVSALGASKVVSEVIRNNVTVITPYQNVMFKVGGFVLGSMAMQGASRWVDATIDQVVEQISIVKKSVDEASVEEVVSNDDELETSKTE